MRYLEIRRKIGKIHGAHTEHRELTRTHNLGHHAFGVTTMVRKAIDLLRNSVDE